MRNPALNRWRQRFPDFWQLMRFDRPVGTLLLLWPTLWALWLASEGGPTLKLLLIFSLGVVLMRAAGCVINDFADRKVDGRVKRTLARPLATGKVAPREAVTLFIVLCLAAFTLVLFTNPLTVALSFGAVALAFCYPFMKRYTHLPQMVLGAAFAWAVPMAFSAQSNLVPPQAWLIYTVVVVWTVVYDTFYAMVDRDDDLRIGVKSTAVLFGELDRAMTGFLQLLVLLGLCLMADTFELHWPFITSIVLAACLFGYQQYLIRFRQREACFQAFLNNNWVGFVVFVGIAVDYALLGEGVY